MSESTKSSLLSFAEARQVVERHASRLSPTRAELVNLLDATGLALAEDLRADRDFPPFARATRDGYALRAADVQAIPAQLRSVGMIKAGSTTEEVTLRDGEAAEIMTGAPLPAGADAVLMVEFVEIAGDAITAKRAVHSGENVVPAAAEARKNTVMVAGGTRVNHSVIAVAAAVGRP